MNLSRYIKYLEKVLAHSTLRAAVISFSHSHDTIPVSAVSVCHLIVYLIFFFKVTTVLKKEELILLMLGCFFWGGRCLIISEIAVS